MNNMMSVRLVGVTLMTFITAGCLSQLKTRDDLRGTGSGSANSQAPRQQQVVESQNVEVSENPSSAPVFKQEERNEQLRLLNGRVEEAENQVQELRQSMIQLAESRQQEKDQAAARLQAYEEAIRNLENQIQELKKQPEPAPQKSQTPSGGGGASNDFSRGEEFFAQKKWKDAIVAYQKYRDQFPKGKQYPDATYKIGLCFLELGLKDESKSFFEEVKVKFPKSPLAKKADKQLKSI